MEKTQSEWNMERFIIENEFRKELQALLKKYNTELDAADHYQGFAECGQDIRMTLYIPATYDKDGDMLRPEVDINLGNFFGNT